MDKIVLDEIRTQQLKSKLYYAGWNNRERTKLLQFLTTYQPTLDDIAGLDRKRLEFARYLVRIGKIKG
jgi:hypothetical protein